MATVPLRQQIEQPGSRRLTHQQLVAIHEALGLGAALPVWHSRGKSPLRLPAAPAGRAR